MARNKHRGSGLDDFLAQEGVLETFEARAIKEVIAFELAEAMRAQKMTKKALAEKLATSRTQIDRLLDPAAENITIHTLQRAAAMVGRKIKIELVAA